MKLWDRLQGLFKRQQSEQGETVTAPERLLRSDELLSPFLIMFVLSVLVVVSSLAVILSAFEYRQLFNQHQELVMQRDELQVEWGQLLLEQSAWAANNRVEQQAIQKLDMRVPEVEQIEIVKNER